jgi:hypothetical protein
MPAYPTVYDEKYQSHDQTNGLPILVIHDPSRFRTTGVIHGSGNDQCCEELRRIETGGTGSQEHKAVNCAATYYQRGDLVRSGFSASSRMDKFIFEEDRRTRRVKASDDAINELEASIKKVSDLRLANAIGRAIFEGDEVASRMYPDPTSKRG